MRKGSDLRGVPIVAFDSGRQFEKVEDLVFDRQANNLLALLVDEGGWFSTANIIPFRDIKTIGKDAILVPSEDVEISASQMPEIEEILNSDDALKGLKLMTTDGRDLGQIADLYFDEQTGKVEGYEVSGGIFADAYSGRSFVPAYQTLQVGGDVAFVPPEVADMMEEQVGGIKAAAQSAGDSISTAATTAGQRVQEVTTTASAAVATRVAQQQKSFVAGKSLQEDVVTDDGQVLFTKGAMVTESDAERAETQGVLGKLYSATGGLTGALADSTRGLTERAGETFSNVTTSGSIDQTLGRRVAQPVRNEDGLIIAAVGQIVTSQVLDRAKTYNRDRELLEATGLTTGDAARARVSTVTASASESVRGGAEQVREGAVQAREKAGTMWQQLKERVSDTQERVSQENEERQIRNALGRPVNRVILDTQDNVILNVGDLITNKAVEQSRASNVLDLLLDSVYTKDPEISQDELRAPMDGEASLEKQNRRS